MIANTPIARVTDEQRDSVCRIGQGAACCRYLTVGVHGFECEKHSDLRSLLDARVAQGDMVAQGDNCEGIKPGFPVVEASEPIAASDEHE
jgi:hypothetical protein